MGAAVAEQHAVRNPELVALGVTAKIVMVVQNEDAGPRPRVLAIEMSGSQPADSATHDHQVVGFPRLCHRPVGIPGLSVPEAMGVGEAAFVIPTQSRASGRVIVRGLFRPKLAVRQRAKPWPVGQQTTHADRNPVQKIPARDLAMHA